MMHKTSILFVIPSLRGGGAERIVTTLLNHIDRSRFTLAIAVIDSRDAVYRSDLSADVEFIDLGCTRVLSALPTIFSLIRKRRPNIVFSTLSHLNLALAILRPIFSRNTLFIGRESIVLVEMLKTQKWSLFWRWGYRHYYKKLDLMICQSSDMRNDLVANFCVPVGKTVVINNPVDAMRIQSMMQEPLPEDGSFVGNGCFNLVSAGRLNAQKGFDLLFQAIALLNDSRVYLTILGEGALKESLKTQVINLGISKQVRFVGFQRNPYVWFAHADAFVLSSRYEGFPNVVLEALACRTPVIANPAPGGTWEILNNIPGCVVSEEISAPALAEAIRSWLVSDRRKIADEAIGPYSLSNIVSQYEREFDKVIRSGYSN